MGSNLLNKKVRINYHKNSSVVTMLHTYSSATERKNNKRRQKIQITLLTKNNVKNHSGSYLILICYLNTYVHFILRSSIILHKNSASTYPIFRTKKQHAEIQIHCRS